tara:strand:- start:775 stop:945 length:171 start_codon:yes stop_codon:yes gene_type:complete
MKYKLLKDWFSHRHNRTIKEGAYVIIKDQAEIEDLIEQECIEKIVEKKKKKKKSKY